ncbi:hypothetical protein ACNAN0_04475 [Agrilactobacillus fermenti]|uniref:hypothetical protein n=1 Tax=Agrilactobacillus fermenti TaxID=2586909 RepID=UPI003A5BC4C6
MKQKGAETLKNREQLIILISLCLGLVLAGFTTNQASAQISRNVQNNLTTTPIDDMRVNPDTGRQYQRNEGILTATGVYDAEKQGTNNKDLVTTNNDEITGGESPMLIRPYTSGGGFGKAPWFSWNYLESPSGKAPGFIGFDNATQANNFTPTFNGNNFVNKMDRTGTMPVLDNDKSYDNGYLNVSGNVPVSVKIRKQKNAALHLMAGNWGVMIRVKVPKDIDRVSLANAIDWERAYFNLSLQTVTGGDWTGTYNFPLQFDHHVYLDPDDETAFYLKVKGVPYKITHTDSLLLNPKATFNLLNYASDAVDYKNNLTVNQNGTGTQSYLEENGKTASALGFQKAWALGSAVNNLGNIGSASALINLASGELFNYEFDPGLSQTFTWLTQFFIEQGFQGNANINFNFDLSKYNGNLTDAYKGLTKARLFPSPNSDGLFNQDNGLGGNRRDIGIDLYGTDQLTDPYSVGESAITQNNIIHNTGTFKGNTPMDYAVVKRDQVEHGTKYPVYTNFSSWNVFIAPFDNIIDRKNVGPDQSALPTDYVSGFNIRNRVANPDPAIDGVVVNPASDTPYTTTGDTTSTDSNSPYRLTDNGLAGVVTPQRYTKAFSYFNFATGQVDPQEIVNDPDLRLQATPTNASSANPAGGTVDALPSGNVTWALNGTYGPYNVPVAGSQLNVNQLLDPILTSAVPNTIVVSRQNLLNGQAHVINAAGSWVDGFPGPDSLTITSNDTPSVTTTTGDILNQTQDNQLNLRIENDTTNTPGGTLAVTTENEQHVVNAMIGLNLQNTSGIYTYQLTLARPNGIIAQDKAGNRWTTASGSDQAMKEIRILVVDDAQSSLRLEKGFVIGTHTTDTKYVSQNGDKVIVNVKGKQTSDQALNGDIYLQVPTINGATLNTATGVTVNYNGQTYPTTYNSFVSYPGFNAYQWTLPNGGSLPVDAEFTYTYTYDVTDISQVPDQSDILDMAFTLDGFTSRYLGQSNQVTLLKASGPQLLSVPELDFGTNQLESGSQPRQLENKNGTPTIELYDNSITDSWTLSAVMTPFTNPDTQKQLAADQSAVNIELGQATTTNNGNQDPNLIVNHTAQKLFADGSTPSILYVLDRSLEESSQNQISLAYRDNAKLNIPDNVWQQIIPGKYEAYINYHVTLGP